MIPHVAVSLLEQPGYVFWGGIVVEAINPDIACMDGVEQCARLLRNMKNSSGRADSRGCEPSNMNGKPFVPFSTETLDRAFFQHGRFCRRDHITRNSSNAH